MSEPTPGSPDPREVRAREAAEIVARVAGVHYARGWPPFTATRQPVEA